MFGEVCVWFGDRQTLCKEMCLLGGSVPVQGALNWEYRFRSHRSAWGGACDV